MIDWFIFLDIVISVSIIYGVVRLYEFMCELEIIVKDIRDKQR